MSVFHGLFIIRRCKFHIISQLFMKFYHTYIFHLSNANIKHYYGELKGWVYSFFDEVESDEWFNLSRHLLENFLTKKKDIVRSLRKDTCNEVMEYLNYDLFPHSHHFWFHHYRTLLCFNASTTSPLEGLNNKIKMNGMVVKSNSSLPISARVLDSQGKEKMLIEEWYHPQS